MCGSASCRPPTTAWPAGAWPRPRSRTQPGRQACRRATVYRYFPGGRDELIGAVVAWEFARFFLRLYEEVHDAETLEEVMERGLVFAHNAILEHEVLQRILQTEPEMLLPRLTVEANETHKLIAAFLVPYLVRHGMAEGMDLDAAADFLARMVLSYIGSPGRWDLNDPEQVARLVRGRAPGRRPMTVDHLCQPPRSCGFGGLRPL